MIPDVGLEVMHGVLTVSSDIRPQRSVHILYVALGTILIHIVYVLSYLPPTIVVSMYFRRHLGLRYSSFPPVDALRMTIPIQFGISTSWNRLWALFGTGSGKRTSALKWAPTFTI